jgi:hypothetical protein
MKIGTYTALGKTPNGEFKTLYVEAYTQQEAEILARAKASSRGLKFIADSVDFDDEDENNFGITF